MGFSTRRASSSPPALSAPGNGSRSACDGSHVTFRGPIPSHRWMQEEHHDWHDPARPGRWGVAHGVSSANEMSNPAESFEPYRRRLLGLAYRMLGSMADAEDAVQETYVRWHGADRDRVSDPRAFLMTATTRICLDMLTSARARREEYVGPWLPEPVLDTAALAPDSRTEL